MELSHGFAELLAAQDVEVQVMDTLTAVITAVGNHAETVYQAFASGNLGDYFKNVGNNSRVVGSDGAAAVDVSLGNHQNVSGCLGSDVPEGVDGLVFIDLGGGDVPGDNFAE